MITLPPLQASALCGIYGFKDPMLITCAGEISCVEFSLLQHLSVLTLPNIAVWQSLDDRSFSAYLIQKQCLNYWRINTQLLGPYVQL